MNNNLSTWISNRSQRFEKFFKELIQVLWESQFRVNHLKIVSKMHFVINNTQLSLVNNQLVINAENVPVNQKTYDALSFLLASENEVVEFIT